MIDDIDWAKKITEAKLTSELVEKFNKVMKNLDGKSVYNLCIKNTLKKAGI